MEMTTKRDNRQSQQTNPEKEKCENHHSQGLGEIRGECGRHTAYGIFPERADQDNDSMPHVYN